MRYFLIAFISILALYACHSKQVSDENTLQEEHLIITEELSKPETTIIDSRYTFTEAIEGSNAPKEVIDKLTLMDVTYLSTDEKLHQGQILTNQRLAEDIQQLFEYMLEHDFMIDKAIPIVAYNWNDSLSMANNNTYSFCYRNISYSCHAQGLAIDINPRFNPVRWKTKNLPNQPIGAVLDTTVNGTLYLSHPVVKEFRKRGFRWGHTFSKYWDDHHFEKKCEK
ncbi:MAG: M15 family metallopeptidase [Candidatus Saccharimonadaceae bacterium]